MGQQVTYQDLLRERLAYGTPQAVIERLGEWRDALGLSGIIIEPNVGGRTPPERVNNSIRLFAQEGCPRATVMQPSAASAAHHLASGQHALFG